MHIELGRFEQAEEQLQFLEAQTLGPEEREHVRSALIALQARTQLMKPIQALLESGDLPAFHSVLKALPPEQLQIDEFALTPIAHWAEQMQAIRGRHEPLALRPLPEDWVQIEAAHMIPLVDSPASFRATQLNPPVWAGTELQCRQTENMVSAIQLARKHYGLINDPIGSETLIRYLHGTCTRGVSMEGLFPGHFKYTQSRALGHPTARHVLPARASGTWRHVVEVFISTTEPRFERAAFIFLALVSIHPFSDGNGRVALTLMNRELISAGLMPALFSNELGPQGLLGVAEERAHTVGAVDQFLEAVLAGQRHALAFISALEEYDHSQ
jgi:hypothetical protein